MPHDQLGPKRHRQILAVYGRELMEYLHSSGTYVALAFFFLLAGASFVSIVTEFSDLYAKAHSNALTDELPKVNVTEQVITPFFLLLDFLMVLVVPMLTMRLVADERRSGMFELLVSTPLDNVDILLGKYFAALTIGWFMLVGCSVFPILCIAYAEPEIPVILACFVGSAFLVAAYTALGVFASALTENQIAAGAISLVGLLLFHLINTLIKMGRIGVFAGALSLRQHYETFTHGVVALQDLVFFVLFVAFFLFLAVQVLDARRWRC
jgi:ABC-2 type transport system permease protein